MESKHKYLAKNTLLFAVSSFVPKVLAFFLIPIYTDCLTTEEYGIADLISTTVELAIPIFTLTIYDAVLRFILSERYKKDQVILVGMRITTIGTIILICISIFAWLLFDFVKVDYMIFFILMYAISSYKNVFSVVLRGTNKVFVLAIGGILNSIITLSTNILFLVVFKWGLTGYLLANTLGGACSLIVEFLCGKCYKYIGAKIDRTIKAEMIRFSFPMIFSALAWWVNNASDRYIISLIAGVSVSGLYAVASKIPSMLSVFQSVFSQAWSVSAIKDFDPDDSDGFIGNMYTIFNFCMIAVAMGLILVNVFVSKILFSNEFFTAWKYVPPLIVACVFNAFSVFTGGLLMAVKDTKSRSVATIIGAVTNTALNIMLIPFAEGYGAAVATGIGFMVAYVYQEIKIRRYIKMKTNTIQNYIGCLLLLLQMFFAYWGNQFILVQCAILLIFYFLYFNVLKGIIGKIWKTMFKRRI